VTPAEGDVERALGRLPKTTAEIVALEERWQVPTYAKFPVAIVRGEGCHVWDAEGRRFLDLYGGHAVALAGHCHHRVVAAIRAQAGRLVFYSNVVHNDVRARAVTRLAALAPEGLARVFLCNSGTEANETALKVARKHTGRLRVVAMSDGFHGRTTGSLAVTGLAKYRDPAYPLPTEHTTFVPYADEAALRAAMTDDVAAVILEPIPSMGGIRVAPASWFRALRDLCSSHGALLVFDEVQTGFGRTGTTFAGEQFGVTPDLITGAKGVAGGFPAGVVFVREDVAAKVAIGDQGTTFGGGPLACAAISATVGVLVEERLAANATRVGARLREALERVPGVREVAGLGLMLGVNLDRPSKPVVRALFDRGFLVGGSDADPRQVRLLPPLTLSVEDAESFPPALASVLSEPAPAVAGRS
jgi:acetylornithine aminotransferase/acetylornithine/N-succinyldiaminopimelate aminotransferase